VIIISRDAFNQAPTWRSVIVVPVIHAGGSSAPRTDRRAAAPGCGGLAEGSVAQCHQVTPLDRGKLAALLGSLSVEQMRAVEDGVRIALALQ
jgi:mRNA-degrading endonuclease toxin of MazEF toxin-antitoxin module